MKSSTKFNSSGSFQSVSLSPNIFKLNHMIFDSSASSGHFVQTDIYEFYIAQLVDGLVNLIWPFPCRAKCSAFLHAGHAHTVCSKSCDFTGKKLPFISNYDIHPDLQIEANKFGRNRCKGCPLTKIISSFITMMHYKIYTRNHPQVKFLLPCIRYAQGTN